MDTSIFNADSVLRMAFEIVVFPEQGTALLIITILFL